MYHRASISATQLSSLANIDWTEFSYTQLMLSLCTDARGAVREGPLPWECYTPITLSLVCLRDTCGQEEDL